MLTSASIQRAVPWLPIRLSFTLLTQARARKVPWLQVADALLSLEAQSLGGPTGQPWIQIAADRSGYTTNQIRRMTRVAQFIRRLVAEGQLKDAEILSSMRFSHLETAMRIYNFEPDTALKVISTRMDPPHLSGSTGDLSAPS